MKRIIVCGCLIALIAGCQTSDRKATGGISREEGNKVLHDSAHYTTIQWLDSTFRDLGKVKEGQDVEVAFRFKNTGNANLVITDVTAGCGCTIPEKPGKPYAPGEEGTIKAKFSSKGRPVGVARKDIYVTANTSPSNSSSLTFQVDITN